MNRDLVPCGFWAFDIERSAPRSQVSVLLINAVAILSEDRFLARLNFSPSSYDPAFGQSPDASVKARTINLIASVRTLMRIPLIIVNTLIIIYEIVFG